MLFSSIVFMNKTLRRQWISVILVFVIKLNIATNSQTPHEKPVKFDGDFDSFLKDLGSMVYKSKKPVSAHDTKPTYGSTYTTVPPKAHRRSQNVFNNQKAFLADVLMMKLVSYYEDKYKLTHLAPTTTERITLISSLTSTNNLEAYTVDHSNIDKNEVFNVHNNKPPSRETYESNRRLQRDRQPDIRKMDDYPVPEVVIL